MSGVIVRMEHIRSAKICASGARGFFKRHGLNFADFLVNGIPAEKLLATGDAMAVEVVELASGR